jgi:phosphoglycerate dehydrogenase-like enzyme
MKVLVGPNVMGLERALPELSREHPDVRFVYCAERERVVEEIADAEIYMGHLGREHFVAARKLKWVQSPSTGVNYYLAIPELKDGDCLLTGARGTHSACLAESIFAMILAFTRGIRDSVIAQPGHKWAMRDIRPKLVELTGGTVGFVGYGAMARATAERMKAFGARCIAVDRFPEACPQEHAEVWGLTSLNELLSVSDYVVVTVPYTEQVHGMIGAAQLAKMKPSAILVGISRGGIIDQVALAEALRNGVIAGAALDVFEPEPLPADSELWDIPNLLITPHIAGGTQYEGERIIRIFRENLNRYLNGDRPLINQVDKELGY